MTDLIAVPQTNPWHKLKTLVLDSVSSPMPAHDARLVAALEVHGLTAILTFDKTGFSRFPGIEVIHPAQAAALFEGEEG